MGTWNTNDKPVLTTIPLSETSMIKMFKDGVIPISTITDLSDRIANGNFTAQPSIAETYPNAGGLSVSDQELKNDVYFLYVDGVWSKKVLYRDVLDVDGALGISTGPNIADLTKIRDGYYIHGPTGVEYPAADQNVLGFYKVSSNTLYRVPDIFNGHVCFFDSAQQFISGLGPGSGPTFTTPSNAAYIKVSVHDTQLSTFMLAKASEYPSVYTPFRKEIPGLKMPVDNIEGDITVDVSNVSGLDEQLNDITNSIPGEAIKAIDDPVVWRPVDDSYLTGNNPIEWPNGQMIYKQILSPLTFNSIRFNSRVYNTSAPVTVRVYVNNNFISNFTGLTPAAIVNYSPGQYNSTTQLTEVILSGNVDVSANQYVYVMVYANGSDISYTYWDYMGGAHPHGLMFYEGTNPTGEAWIVNGDNSFNQAEFILLNKSETIKIIEQSVNTNSADIIELQNEVGVGGSGILINLPSKLYATVGERFLIHLDNLIINEEGRYAITVQSPLDDRANDKYYWYTPTSGDVGNKTLTFQVWEKGKVVKFQNVTLVVSAATTISSAKNVLLVGDSTEWPGVFANQIKQNLGNIVSHGVKIGADGVIRTEGRPSWSFELFGTENHWADYYRFKFSNTLNIGVGDVYSVGGVNFTFADGWSEQGSTRIALAFCPIGSTAPATNGTLTKVSGSGPTSVPYTNAIAARSSPFWSVAASGLDIAYYRTEVLGLPSSTKFDLVSFKLGINDIGQTPTSFISETRITNIVGYAIALVNAFKVDNASCKIIIQLTNTCASTGSYVSGTMLQKHKEYFLNNMFRLRNRLIETFDNNAYGANVVIGFAGLYIDRDFGYAIAQSPLGTHYPGINIETAYDSIHPANEGYLEMADGCTPLYRYLLT